MRFKNKGKGTKVVCFHLIKIGKRNVTSHGYVVVSHFSKKNFSLAAVARSCLSRDPDI